MWRINNMPLTNQRINEEIKEIKSLTQMKMQTIFQNIWNTAKEVLRRKFTAIQDYHKRLKISSNNLTLYLNKLEKEKKPKVSRKK